MLINSGVDLYTVGKILGHSSPQTTARYAHLSDASLQKAMRRLR
jgi:site-specific recombinase XerD